MSNKLSIFLVSKKSIKMMITTLCMGFICSCAKEDKPDYWTVRKGLIMEAEKRLAKEHKVHMSFDTLDLNYSIQFEDVMDSLLITKDSKLHDLRRADSTIETIIVNNRHGWKRKYLSLKTPEKTARRILKAKGELIFVFKLHKIRKANTTIECQYEGDDYSITLNEPSEDFIGKGELVDFDFVDYDHEDHGD